VALQNNNQRAPNWLRHWSYLLCPAIQTQGDIVIRKSSVKYFITDEVKRTTESFKPLFLKI